MKDCSAAAAATFEIPASFATLSIISALVMAFSYQSALLLFFRNFSQNTAHPLSRLLLQIAVIVVVSRLLAFPVAKIGQPLVIAEIIAGILLGPSLLGLLLPGLSNFLFPPDSFLNLQFLSQLGLILFMFIIGLELDLHLLKHKTHTALVVRCQHYLPFFRRGQPRLLFV